MIAGARNHLQANRSLEFRFGNRDLTSAVRADGRQLLWQPATVRLATDRARRVYPLGDLRGLVPIPYVALQDMAIREASPLGHHSTLPPAVVAAWVCQESDPSAPPKPRLLDRVRHAIETRHYSRRTEKAWLS